MLQQATPATQFGPEVSCISGPVWRINRRVRLILETNSSGKTLEPTYSSCKLTSIRYAYCYDTRVMLCFDGFTLLVLRWASSDREDLRNVQPSIFVIPADS